MSLCSLLLLCGIATAQETEKPNVEEDLRASHVNVVCGSLNGWTGYVKSEGLELVWMGETDTAQVFDSVWYDPKPPKERRAIGVKHEFFLIRLVNFKDEACLLSRGSTILWELKEKKKDKNG